MVLEYLKWKLKPTTKTEKEDKLVGSAKGYREEHANSIKSYISKIFWYIIYNMWLDNLVFYLGILSPGKNSTLAGEPSVLKEGGVWQLVDPELEFELENSSPM